MKKINLALIIFLSTTNMSAFAAEAGVGRESDNPGAQPPADPAPAETSESLLQQMLESFGLDGGAEQ